MSDTTASTTVLPPLPPRSAVEAAEAGYASDFLPAGADASTDAYPASGAAAAEHASASAGPKRRRGVVVAIIGGGVLAVALIFGGGMWAGWAIGSSQSVSTTFEQGDAPGGGQSGFGPGGTDSEQGTVPGREGSDSSGSDDSDANS
ncbi:MAG: hypothetical protein QM604_05655 [Microbacterium sp.]